MVDTHAPIDPALVLPPAVAAQRDRANALMAQLNGTTAMPNGAGQPTPGGEALAPELTPAQPTNPTPPPFQLGLAQPEPPPQQPPPQQPPQEPLNYETLYRSLKGRWDTEMPRLRESVQTASQRAQQLEQLLGTMQPPGPGLQPQPQANGQLDTSQFTEDELEQWGPDMLATIARIVDRRASAAAQQMVRPLAEQSRHNARNATEDFLDREMPQWREINFHPEFMNWSLLPDPFSGAIRGDLLRRAFEAGEAPRVAYFFRAFLSDMQFSPVSATPQAPIAAAPSQPVPQAQPPASQRIELSDLAAPSGAGGTAGPPPAPVAKRVYRRSEIARFYSEKALGKYNTPELQALAAATEQDIFVAPSENRVING